MVRVIAALAAEDQCTRKLWVPELAMRSFPTRNEAETRRLQVTNNWRILRGTRRKLPQAYARCQPQFQRR